MWEFWRGRGERYESSSRPLFTHLPSATSLCLPECQLVFRDLWCVDRISSSHHAYLHCLCFAIVHVVVGSALRPPPPLLATLLLLPPQMTVSQPLLAARLRLANGSNRRHIASCIARLADATAGRYVGSRRRECDGIGIGFGIVFRLSTCEGCWLSRR
jgi:hypothetical protein